MREILFKGLSDQNQWVYSKSLLDSQESGNLGELTMLKIDGIWWEIDENTLCQYIGLKDKKNKKIFENDIIKYDEEVLLVEYKNGHFFLRIKNSDKIYWFTDIPLYSLEVIGNIHDGVNHD